MSDTPQFGKLVPGFDFLQNLVKGAGAALPGIGQWVAPTLNPEELEKRIEELRTVQFWLEQNARMLGATIQALEVQRMTLSTLKTMNVQMGDLRESLTIRLPEVPSAANGSAAPASKDAGDATVDKPAAGSDGDPAAGAKPGIVDPMQWWSALTKQFTELATTAIKETSSAVLKTSATAGAATAMAPGFDAAAEALRSAVAAATASAAPVARSPAKRAAKVAPKAAAAPRKKAAARKR